MTAFVARRADGLALAESISWLGQDPQVYNAMSAAIADTQDQRSIARCRAADYVSLLIAAEKVVIHSQ